MKNNSAPDYIELSINNNEDNDEPPDHVKQDDSTFDKEENYKPTTALLTDIEESDSDDFILYENNENKPKPKHENTLALQVKYIILCEVV
jgi:hypothetical protein